MRQTRHRSRAARKEVRQNTHKTLDTPKKIGQYYLMTLPVDYNNLHYTERRAVRERYIELQNGLCHECGKPLSGPPSKWATDKPINKTLFPKDFFKWPIHLHHDHDTGLTVGAVHNYCNAVLWQYYGE